jgi:uncharacterized membrane protein YbaN (DUF454 family)
MKQKIIKSLWFILGIICLGIAYIGVVTPGIPWSTPTVGAAFCFAKSNKRWHDWIMNHKLFGPFLTNWSEKRVFPTRGKWAMVITMDCSLIILWFTTGNWKLVMGIGAMMLLVSIWAWRYPGTVEEYQQRVANGLKVGWFK